MNQLQQIQWSLNRRAFLKQASASLGSIALASILNPRLFADESAKAERWKGILGQTHHTPKIKRVIHLYMAGGPSHLETLDYKPTLAKMHGQPMPESLTKGQPIAQLQGQKLNCFGPQHAFKRYGKSGQEICEIFPKIGEVADNITIIRSMVTEAINHDPAHTLMNTGTTISGRPAMGSWVLYGLGSEAEDLPGFIVLTSTGKFGQAQPISARQWHSGFLPSRFQGVLLRSKGDPVLYVRTPKGISDEAQRETVETIQQLNHMRYREVEDPEILTRISQYEMAFRMQTSVPGLTDISNEPQHILDMYGTKGADGSFGANCLLARRLAERGVRFIQCYHRDWDHHGSLKRDVEGTAKEVDQAAAALITDLKQRGMLDETLVIWGGEFGRTPMAQGNGRDHHIKGFSIWMAGGGIKPGMSYGATDEFGYNSVENIVHVHDLHATIMHLFGIDHKKLTFKFQGRDFRLTDVSGEVIKPIMA
jgi:hypothetical protein